MKIKLFAADAGGCGFYRMRLPGKTVQELASDVEIVIVDSMDHDDALVVHLDGRVGDAHVSAVDDPECDVIVLQRPMARELIEAIPLIQQWGTAVVVEVDDDFERVHPNNPAWRGMQPMFSPLSNTLWFNLAVQLADLVTVSTPALVKRYGSHGRVRELPNYVPESYLTVNDQHEGSGVQIGWPGNSKVHPGDLKVVGTAVADVVAETGCGFRAVGTALTFTDLGLDPDDDACTLVEWVPLDEYPNEVSKIDVGIVPLALTPFNRAKSWLKGLEYAALGVPYVASPLQQYKRLNHLGAGEIAGGHRDWERHLRRYVEDDEFRRLISEEGRIVASALTIEKHAERWLEAWTGAVATRRSL